MARGKRPDRLYEGRKTQALGRSGAGMNVIGAKIRAARLARTPQWSQGELSQAIAQQCGFELSPTTLSKIERSERSVYDFELQALARTLGLDLNVLLEIT
jgi:transcriptional regulator with XRE-family HTH domain